MKLLPIELSNGKKIEGAKTGAKVGLGGAILTGGNQAEIKAGTLLEFSLTEAVNL